MPRKSVISILFACCTVSMVAQELTTGLTSNYSVRSWHEKNSMKKGYATSDTLEIPFFDDFSGRGVYPEKGKWQDNYVFVNNTFSVKQRSCGVATFDVLDSSGRLYETASSLPFAADRLTSQPINLKYTASDEIFISFLYEAGGLSDLPETKDSLTLQFYAPKEDKWYSVWRSSAAQPDTFKTVILPIDASRYLLKGFRFRFVNYASLNTSSGDPSMVTNSDIWNIDYVLIEKNRGLADTLARDVAFTRPVRSVLKTYESMPWKQFRQVFLSEMGPWISVHYLNNDKITRNVTRNFEIFDVYRNSISYTFTAGATNIPPFTAVNYNANLLYTFNTLNPDSALFEIRSYLITDVFDPKPNDTIIYRQRFGSYFAFDDGSAEAGYGINGLGSRNAMFAYRYKSFIPDTLRAIQIAFNDSYLNSNLRTFDLMVWSNNSGVPGDMILTQEEMSVMQGSGINGFYTYYLNDPIEINGEFFIGWKQRSETFLNAGVDLNTPHKGRQMYWLNGNWNSSQSAGSVMIRPVFGPRRNTTSAGSLIADEMKIRIWPNPATTYFIVDRGEYPLSGNLTIRVFDLNGRELIRGSYNDRVDVSALAAGVYLVTFEINGRKAGYSRLLKSN